MRDGAPLRARILAALRRGPLTLEDLAEVLGSHRKRTGQECRSLALNGRLRKVPSGSKHAIYELVAESPGEEPRALRKDEARAVGAEYMASRMRGERRETIIARLRLKPTAAEAFEEAFRFHISAGKSVDGSCPRFAHHDRHLAAAWMAKGFPTWSENRGPQPGRAVVCLPIIWPSATIEEARA